MKKLNVIFYREKNEKFPVGQLAESRNRIYFEYDPDFLAAPLWLSPFKLPPEPGLHEHKDRNFGPLFGLFDDSLPDGWGLTLMDRFFRKQGINVAGLSILDRLAFLGSATMGALTYEPATEHDKSDNGEFDLHQLAEQSRQIMEGQSDTVLPQLMRAGGSPGGARPKVLAGIHGNQIISGEDDLPKDFEHWIIKFNSKNDLPDSGAVEYAYSLMARNAGINMPETRLFPTKPGDSFFGIKRFDRMENRRFHVHTFGNMIHANFRIPSMDYDDLLKVIKILTENHRETLRGFRQMIFNLLANNRDDHVKNFAFMMDENQEWQLTPAYDLTFSDGPGGEHSMTFLGEGQSPGKNEIMQLGKRAGLTTIEVNRCLDQVLHAVKTWPDHARAANVTPKSTAMIKSVINRNIKAL
ncbi:MAG: type II toxin-antitoxin system HipA family toxin [Desulfobacteraceae bacterium]|nr:type II toxin-antitoxin system HipA family toxin [Desulfobacteraceae bacterium]